MATPTTANRQIARAAATIMAPFALSQITGLVRQILVTRAFGTSPAYDAFVVANNFPNLIFTLVAGGALASAFVPTFTGLVTQKNEAAAWRLASAIANLILIILTALSLIAAIFAPQIVKYILVSGFSDEKIALTAALLRIMLISPAIFGVSGLLMGILNTHQRFLLPALAPSMYWIGMILGLFFFVPSMGIFGLAWGTVLGSVLHLLIQLPDLRRLPAKKYIPTLGLGNSQVAEVIRLMAPRLFGAGTVQLYVVVNAYFATKLPEGSVSALTYAWALMTVPEVVIAQSIAIAILPTFSAQVARGEMDGLRASLAATLRGLLLLSVPAMVGLILLRTPVIAMLFQRGFFSSQSTELVAWALLWYTVGLIGHSMVEVLVRAFYALHDTKTPVIIGSIAMLINVGLIFLFPGWFSRSGWLPLGGLALANSVATTLEMSALLVVMRVRLGGIHGRQVLGSLGQAALASAAMGLVLWGWLRLTQSAAVSMAAIGGVLLGGGVYALGMLVLRVPELGQLISALQRRVMKTLENREQTAEDK